MNLPGQILSQNEPVRHAQASAGLLNIQVYLKVAFALYGIQIGACRRGRIWLDIHLPK